MKKIIILLFLFNSTNTYPQDDWLKANLDNRWQYIKNYYNQTYTLFTGQFTNTAIFNDTIFYKFNVPPYKSYYMRFDSSVNFIEMMCFDEKFPHCNFNLPNGYYSNLKSPSFASAYGCANGITITADSFSFSNQIYETRKANWDFYFPPDINDIFTTIYAKNLGIIYHYNKDRYQRFNAYSLFQCLVDGVIYKDSIEMGFEINPILRITDPNFILIFKVTHPYNKIFPVGSGKTSLLMIDSVWFYSFYEKNGDTIAVEPKQAGWIVGTENFHINTNIDLNLLSNGYSFNYRFKAVDKGLDPNILYIPNSGFYKAYLDSTIDVDYAYNPLMEYELEQNFPNPFNSSTVIRFYAPEEDDISIEVFNILGQKVATLFNQRANPGKYEVYFYENYNDNINSSTIYFYQMKSSKKTITKK